MPSTFLLEIGTEELPAEFVGSALDQLKKTVVSDLAELRLVHGEVTVTGTPRRLVVRVESLIDRQSDLEEERKGPPLSKRWWMVNPVQLRLVLPSGVEWIL